MTKSIHKYCTILLLGLLTSCVVYQPQVAPVSLIKEKGDLQFNIGAIFPSTGVYANANYGINSFISSQLYGSFYLPGIYHIDFNSGFYKNINKINIGIWGGYAYGQGQLYDGGGMRKQTYWKGDYSLPYCKIQLIKESKRYHFGIIFKYGFLTPNYTQTIDTSLVVLRDRKMYILEPSLIFNLKLFDRLSVTFNYTNALIRPIERFDKYNTVHHDISHNAAGNLGVGVVYIIKTGHNTTYDNNEQ